jgi:hypothetical protein
MAFISIYTWKKQEMHDLKYILVSVRVVKIIGAKKQKIPMYSFFSTKNHSHVPYQ